MASIVVFCSMQSWGTDACRKRFLARFDPHRHEGRGCPWRHAEHLAIATEVWEESGSPAMLKTLKAKYTDEVLREMGRRAIEEGSSSDLHRLQVLGEVSKAQGSTGDWKVVTAILDQIFKPKVSFCVCLCVCVCVCKL